MVKKSNYQELEAERIKEIVRGARSAPHRNNMPWFYRGEILGLLALALEHEQDTIIIDGKQFTISYNNGEANVSPSDGSFVPCAHIKVENYLKEWDAYERATRITRLSDQERAG